MRNINVNALAKLMENDGTEPVNILSVKWGNKEVWYADRDVDTISGKILSVTEVDDVVGISDNTTSQEVEIKLSDIDGSLKALLDSQDIHQKTAKLYQWFTGLDLNDKFLIFSGKVSSPIIWSEGDRTLTFSIVSQLEDKEFGFSAEEGQFPFIPKDLVGKPWPVLFGKCLDIPALRVNQAVSGSTLCGVGIISGADLQLDAPVGAIDCGLGASLAMISAQISFLNACAAAYGTINSAKAAEIRDQANSLRESMAQSASQQATQTNCIVTKRQNKIDAAKNTGEGCNPIKVLGGEDFPQDTPITLDINGGLFTGIMRDDEFHVSTRRHLENEATAQEAFDSIGNNSCSTPSPAQQFDFQMQVPPGKGDPLNPNIIRRHGFIVCTLPQSSTPTVTQIAQQFWADAGSRVVLHGNEPITYIVSITPGEVLAVKAFKTLNGLRKLVNVPNDLWSVRSKQYGTITAVELTTIKPLSSIPDQGWEDDIFVTFKSTIGPDIVEILKWIIDNYTDLAYDADSFNAVSTKLDKFPSGFPVLNRRNTIDLLQQIAYEARCALWLKDDKFYLKYLAEEPTSDLTVTDDDIDLDSLEIELTPTEDLVTKMEVTWHLSYAAEEPEKIILRHNVKKYGTKEQSYDWLIYNQPDIIYKAATFWLIRKSHTWKTVRFSGGLNLLKLETFDTITISYAGASPVKAVVQKAEYDSASNTVSVSCLTPVQAGTKTVDPFFWPAALPISKTFPPKEDIIAGFAGGDGIGAGATGMLPIGNTSGIESGGTVFVGGPNVVFKSRADRGDPTPTDNGFTAQEIVQETVFANLDVRPNPKPDLTIDYVDPLLPVTPQIQTAGDIIIDIRTTKVVDSGNEDPNLSGLLSSLVKEIDSDTSKLAIDTEAMVSDGTNKKAFDFKFDEDTAKWGAGTAFAQDA